MGIRELKRKLYIINFYVRSVINMYVMSIMNIISIIIYSLYHSLINVLIFLSYRMRLKSN